MSEFITNLFPVPVWQGSHTDEILNKKFKDLCYEWKDKPETDGLVSDGWEKGLRSQDKEDQDKNGVTTFYSDNLIQHEEWSECVKFITDFCGHMLSTTHDLSDTSIQLANMWTTIYPEGGYVPQHIHNNTLMSGVYYVQAKEDAGDLIFTDPAWIAKGMLTLGAHSTCFPQGGSKFTIPVHDNKIVIFPSWLPHHTLANNSGKDRIIISFNLLFNNGATNQIIKEKEVGDAG